MAFGNFYYQNRNPGESLNNSRGRRSYDGISNQTEAQIYTDILRRHSNPTAGPSAPSYEDIFSSSNLNEQSNNQENLPKNFLELEHLDNRLRPPFISHSNPTTPFRNNPIIGIPLGPYDISESTLSSRDNYYSTFAMNVPEIRTYMQYLQDDEQPCCSSSTSRQRSHSLNQDENVRLSPTWTSGGIRENRYQGRHHNQNHRHSPRPRVPSPLIFNYDLPEIIGGNENVDNEREEENNDESGSHNLLSPDSDDPPSYEECIGQIGTKMQGLALRDTIF